MQSFLKYWYIVSVDFLKLLKAKWDEGKFVCVGLDTEAVFEFNKTIIDSTHDLVCAYKLNSAFYEAGGAVGWTILKDTINYIHTTYPDIPTILDAKRADTDTTNRAYARAIFDNLGADALTVSPYLGKESLKPFLERRDKGIFVLVKTSNPGAGEFQDLEVYPERSRRGKPLYQVVAEHVTRWNENGNLGVVAGATYPEDLAKVRKIVGDLPILVPGIGAQGGDLKATLQNSLDSKKQGLIIHSARGIILSPNPREAALRLHREIVDLVNRL